MCDTVTPPHILVVKLSAIGDTVHAVPAVAALRHAFPDAFIGWIVESTAEPLVSCVSEVDRVYCLPRWSKQKDKWRTLREIHQIIRTLRHESWDVAIDFQGLVKSAVIARLSGARKRIGFSRSVIREKLACLMYTHCVPPRVSHAHVVDHCASLLEPLGITDVPWIFPYQPPATAKSWCDTLCADKQPYVVFNLGAAWPSKRWPPEHFAALAEQIHAQLHLKIMVPYGPGDEALIAAFEEFHPPATTIRSSLWEMAVMASQSLCLVSGDSGPMHLASALGTPVVALMGPTSPERNGPLHTMDSTLTTACPQRPCHQRQCPKHATCLDMSPEDVFQVLKGRLLPRHD